MHIHFGMSGRFRTWALGEEPETTATTRLRIAAVDGSVGGHVSAMTVNIGTMELYEEKEAELGPDPLRPDADPERFFAKMDTARGGAKPVGLALMDQSWIAGVGNIYRAEILFRAGVHPEEPCSALSRDARTRIWNESVVCLQRGFETGSILTVDPAEGLPEPWKRRYIYNHKACGRCGGPVLSWDMANRTAYACGGKCQPLMVEGGVGALTAPRRKALAAAKKHVSFVSHCAPEPAPNAKGKGKVETDANQLHVGADVEDAGEPSDDVDNIGVLPTPATPAAARAIASTAETPTPGARARRMVGPSAAAAEKARAGEKKNVEHVALEDATPPCERRVTPPWHTKTTTHGRRRSS